MFAPNNNLTSWSWTDELLSIVLLLVAATTILFTLVHSFMHLWCFYGIAQIGRKEGRLGSVQTFNQGEGRGRVIMCILIGGFYALFIGFFLVTVLMLLSSKQYAPEWMRMPWQPLSPDELKSLFYGFFIIYASPAVISAITTTIAFVYDRIKMSKLKARKADADARRGYSGGAAATSEAGFHDNPASAAVTAGQRSYDWDKDVIILVPTYQEPLSNLLSTISAITESDYPPEKIHVLVGFDDDSEKTLTTMFTIERILNGGVVHGYNGQGAATAGGSPSSSRSGSYAAGEYDLGANTNPYGGNGGDTDSLPAYDDLPSAKGRNKYNGLLKIAHLTRSSVDLRSGASPASMASLPPPSALSLAFDDVPEEDPRAIEINYRNIKYTIARYEHGGKLHTQAKMFALVEERVNAGVYPRDALLLFVDSDTTLVPSTIRKFVDHFEVHKSRACATGFIVSRNGHGNNFLQQMQDAEYIFMQVSMRYVEASFGSVTCLPGALTMIKYSIMSELAKIYFHQPDVDSTFEFCRRKLGEDRFLTHLAMEYLGPFSIGFVPDAVSKTEAPNLFYDLLRQRRRWLLGSLTNELYMVTTPSFLVKYPALMALRIISIMRLGGTVLYVALVEAIILLADHPEQFTALDFVVLLGTPIMFWCFLTGWAVWQRRIKSLFFFFFYILGNQILELLYYAYSLWTLRERTWGGPRAAGETETDQSATSMAVDTSAAPSYSMPYTPPASGAPSPMFQPSQPGANGGSPLAIQPTYWSQQQQPLQR
ncbi:hypothetical protein H9P43_006742 [Blastocladiella emersonii ATCC 22665]|nr:hypothetical protein H9P43_006742 [Blastocladiella emersonii ATCC 22665]